MKSNLFQECKIYPIFKINDGVNMADLGKLKHGSLKGESLEITNLRNSESGYFLDFSKTEKDILNDIGNAINSGARPIKLNIVIDKESELFNKAVNGLKNDDPKTLKEIAIENSQISQKLQAIGPVFGYRVDLSVLDVSKNELITDWKKVDKVQTPTEKQYLTGFEARLKQAWEKGILSPKELISLSGNHQNASLVTGQKIDSTSPQVLKETPKKDISSLKPIDQNKPMTPSQLEAERKKVFDLIKNIQPGNDVKVMKPKPGAHDGFIVGVTDHFVVQRLGSESRYFMVHDKVDLPTAKVDLSERVRVHRNEQGNSKIESLSKSQEQNKNMGLKR